MQLHALKDTVGRSKASVLAARVAEINPECRVDVREQWLLADGALELLRAERARHEAGGDVAEGRRVEREGERRVQAVLNQIAGRLPPQGAPEHGRR